MSNFDKARKLTQVAAESQGMAELKYQAYMESSEAATKRLQNAWEGLTNTFRASDLLKGFKDTISWFVENLLANKPNVNPQRYSLRKIINAYMYSAVASFAKQKIMLSGSPNP